MIEKIWGLLDIPAAFLVCLLLGRGSAQVFGFNVERVALVSVKN